jgi:hypothetical protein
MIHHYGVYCKYQSVKGPRFGRLAIFNSNKYKK